MMNVIKGLFSHSCANTCFHNLWYNYVIENLRCIFSNTEYVSSFINNTVPLSVINTILTKNGESNILQFFNNIIQLKNNYKTITKQLQNHSFILYYIIRPTKYYLYSTCTCIVHVRGYYQLQNYTGKLH